jgi:acrylyl-CoA reductase (NADPH)
MRAYRLFQEGGTVAGRVVDVERDALSPGPVVVQATYSSVNFKDARVATGTFRGAIEYPRVPGIDVAGTVVASADPRFREGDQVIATGYELGVGHDGGYAEEVRLPGDWLVPLPHGFTPFEAMAIGTAGFTAALSIIDLERNGLTPERGPVIVTGATGGVGSMAVDCLSRLGYQVTAVTGKSDRHDYLRALGAREIVARDQLPGLDMQDESRAGKHDPPSRPAPVGEPLWAGAIDPVGGGTLAALTRTMRYGGGIANSGLTGGAELHTTVLPFILRGVKILGIDSVLCPMPARLEAWRRLATDMRPAHLASMARQVTLDDLDGVFASLLAGSNTGRTVVRLS